MWHLGILFACLLNVLAAAADKPADVYAFGDATLPAPAAVEPETRFRLTAAGATIAEGTVADTRAIETPGVRGRLRATLAIDGQPDATVVLLPRDERDRLADLAVGLNISIVGPAGNAVDRLLPNARGVDRPEALRLSRPDAIVIAAGALADVPPGEQAVLSELAAAGVAVLVLTQPPGDLFGVRIGDPQAVSLVWKRDALVDRLRRVLAEVDLQPVRPLALLPADAGVAVGVAEGDERGAAALRTDDGLILWQLPFDATDARLTLLLTAFLEGAAEPELP